MSNYQEIIDYCQINNRICPLPQKWNELWLLLKERKQAGNNWEPPLPLILGAWNNTSNLLKKERLKEHIKWAEQQNQLIVICDFLHSLKEVDWFHERD